ncbi:MAG: polyisoprenoid-binding protein [Ignavibacteriaceae bacterium]|nr:polyisoprenoid-binding protein [Ignavibacteriaceae bacterium]
MKQFFLLVFSFVFATAVFAQTWNLDRSHSGVKFSVSHMVITDVDGSFKEFEVNATPNSKGELEKVEATIKVESIDTENKDRDNHLRSADFFDAANYPEIKFVSTKIEKKGKNGVKIYGDLTMRGVTKKVVLDGKFNGQVKDPWGNTKVGYTATTTVNRFDYGLQWNKAIETGALVVGKDVKITLNAQFVVKS